MRHLCALIVLALFHSISAHASNEAQGKPQQKPKAQTTINLYGGKSFTNDSSLRVSQPGNNTNLTFHRVSYEDRSFEQPMYYGIRITHFPAKPDWLGYSLDFFHFKIYAQTNETVRVTGIENGNPVNRTQRLGDTVQRFSISHGVNYLTVNVLAKHRLMADERFPDGRLTSYVGLGVGTVILHPESVINGRSKHGPYEWDGLGWQLFAGAEFRITPEVGFFLEYKLTNRNVRVNTAEGTATTRINTNHIVFGATWRI